jgi:hypothetical protein
MDGRYYIESVVCLVLGILCFVLPGFQVHNVRTHPEKKDKIHSLHRVVWACTFAIGFLTLIFALDLRGAFGILPLNVRFAMYILDVGFVGIACIEWAVNLVSVVAVSAGVENYRFRGSKRELTTRVVPMILYFIIGFSMEVLCIRMNQIKFIGFMFLYLALLCAISCCLQIFSMRVLHKHYVGGLEMKMYSKDPEIQKSEFKKMFRTPACRLLMTFFVTSSICILLTIAGIVLAFSPVGNNPTTLVLTASDPNNFQISELFAFAISGMVFILIAGLVIAWIPGECIDGPDVITRVTTLVLDLTWCVVGKWVFYGVDALTLKDTLNESLLAKNLKSSDALVVSK